MVELPLDPSVGSRHGSWSSCEALARGAVTPFLPCYSSTFLPSLGLILLTWVLPHRRPSPRPSCHHLGGLLSHMGDVPTYWLFSSLTNHLQGLRHFSHEYSGRTVDFTILWYHSTSKTLHPTPPSLTIPLSLSSCPPGHSHSSCSLSSGRPPGPGSPVFLLSALTLSFSFLLLQEPSLNSLVILTCMLSTWQLCAPTSLARRASRTRLSSPSPPHPGLPWVL